MTETGARKKYRVTALLRRQWADQLGEFREILASGHHDDGRPITAFGRAELRQDIARMKHLLETQPVGSYMVSE